MFNHDSKVPNSKTCKSSNTFHSDKPNANLKVVCENSKNINFKTENESNLVLNLDKIAKVATKNRQNRKMVEFTKKYPSQIYLYKSNDLTHCCRQATLDEITPLRLFHKALLHT